MSPDLVLVGRVARAHGNRGHVIVTPETDFAGDRFQAGRVLLVGPERAPTPRRIREVRFHQRRPILALEGVDSMDDAEALAGADVWMPADALGPLPEGTFHRHDLVGCEVRDTRDAVIGRVTSVEGPMEQSRLVVGDADGDIMIPLAGGICVRIDVASRCIVVDPPEGLLELNRRGNK
jgi:16S rRNA processing protein RimM